MATGPYTTIRHPLARSGEHDAPFVFTAPNGVQYRGVTNGAALSCQVGTFATGELFAPAPRAFADWYDIAHTAERSRPFPLAELRAFAAPVPDYDCPKCERAPDGIPMGCEACDGDGIVLPQASLCIVRGVLLNRPLLAAALDGPDECDVQIARASRWRRRDSAMLCVFGPTWFASVMSMAKWARTPGTRVPTWTVRR